MTVDERDGIGPGLSGLSAAELPRRVLDALLEGCQVIGPEYRYLYLNAAAAAQGRRAPEALVGRTMGEAYPGIEQTAMFAVLRRCVEERSPERMRSRFVFPDGEAGWFELRFEPLADAVLVFSVETTRTELAEERFRAAFEQASVGRALCRPDGRLERASRSLCELLGHAAEELEGRRLSDLAHPGDLGGLDEQVRGLVSGERRAARGEMRLFRRDGRVLWADVGATLLRDERGEPLQLVLDVLDVSARKEAEKALATERENLRATMAAVPVAVLVVDEAERVVRVNPAAERLFGRTVRPRAPVSFGELIGCARRAEAPGGCGEGPRCAACALRSGMARALSEGRGSDELEAEIEVETPGGVERRWLAARVEPLVLSGRRHAVAACHDVTDRKEAAQGLAASEAKARAMYRRLPIPTFVWQLGDEGFVLADFNDAAAEVSEGGVARWVGRPLGELYADAPDIVADIERCHREGTSFRREMDYRYRTRQAVRRLVTTYGAVPPDLVLVHTQDVTEERRNEERARAAERLEAVGKLAGGVAHDFNNLLTVVAIHADNALAALRAEDPIRRDLAQIKAAGERAADLTGQLLAFGRRQVLEPAVLDLNRVVRGLEPMLRRLIGEDVEVEVRLATGLGAVRADPGRVEQVVVNLALNARDAMPGGGRLAIETRNVELDEAPAEGPGPAAAGPFVVLSVADTGAGMDEATRSRIFEPFFTTKERGKGTGLGLATVYGVVTQSGGAIRVRSEPGRGSTFEVLLPRVDAEPTATRGRPQAAGAGAGEVVLVVEDDEPVRNVVVRLLRAAGYRALAAANGGEALLLCERGGGEVDLLLTDVVMPHVSGRQLADRLAPLCPRMRVLYMSGYTDDEIADHGVIEPGTRFLAKPFTATELARKVREVLDEEG